MSRSRKYPVAWIIKIRHPSLKFEKRYCNRLSRRKFNVRKKLYIKYNEEELLSTAKEKIIDFYWIRRYDGKINALKKHFSKEFLDKMKRK